MTKCSILLLVSESQKIRCSRKSCAAWIEIRFYVMNWNPQSSIYLWRVKSLIWTLYRVKGLYCPQFCQQCKGKIKDFQINHYHQVWTDLKECQGPRLKKWHHRILDKQETIFLSECALCNKHIFSSQEKQKSSQHWSLFQCYGSRLTLSLPCNNREATLICNRRYPFYNYIFIKMID